MSDWTYHLCRLRAGNVELEVGILLPVTKKERKLEQEAVVRIAKRCQGLGAGIAV